MTENARDFRRAQQLAAVAAFGQRAIAETDSEALTSAALEHVAAALQSDVARLHEIEADESLRLIGSFGWTESLARAFEETPLCVEARINKLPVMRRMTESDYDAAPWLRENGIISGGASSFTAGEYRYVLSVYSRDREYDVTEVYPLQAIGAMYTAARARTGAEQQLEERQKALSLILEQIPVLLWTVDRDLAFTTAQGAGFRPIGLSPAFLIGKTLGEIVGSQSGILDHLRAAVRGISGDYVGHYEGHTYDNRVEPLRDERGVIIGAVNVALDITERHSAEEQLLVSREELRQVSMRLNLVQESERQRIAREVHDELGQQLTALRLELSLLSRQVQSETPVDVPRSVDEMLVLIDETIATVRRVATELRPMVLDDFGLRAAIEDLLIALEKRTGTAFELHFPDPEPEIEAGRATVLYRIVQEALSNITRHAGANHVRVALEVVNRFLVLTVVDDGRGIAEAAARATTSLGLVGMRERAIAVGGRVDIAPNPAGSGTTVTVRLPLERRG